MKKSYLMIVAVATLFAACAEKDTFKDVANQDVAIGFDGSFIDKATRAELTNEWFANSDENSFGVYGFRINGSAHEQIFDQEKVTWNNTDADWEHPTVRFWDKSKAYNFYAYAPYDADVAFANEKFTFNNLSLIQQIDAVDGNNDPVVTDIAIAIKQGVYYSQTKTHVTSGASTNGHDEGDVEFIFSHILSKLNFKVKSSTDPIYAKIRVTEVKIDFPSLPSAGTASWAQTADNAVAGTTTISGPLAVQDAIAANGTVTETNFSIPVFSAQSTGTQWLNYDLDGAKRNTAIDLEEWTWTNATTPAAQNNEDNKANEFIVIPVESGENDDVKGYEFAVKVVYDIQYMKLKSGKDASSTNINDYEEVTGQEIGCVATGIIEAANYNPKQNELWTVTIDVNPATIEFCVDKINGFDPAQTADVTVK